MADRSRKFVEIEESYPEPSNKVLDWIARLYDFEREVPRGGTPEAEAVLRLRAELRQARSRPVVEELRG